MGGLRLTEKLAGEFCRVLRLAAAIARAEGESTLAVELLVLADHSSQLGEPGNPGTFDDIALVVGGEGWVSLVAAGQRAVHHSVGTCKEATVIGYYFTPSGIQYRIPHPRGDKIACSVTWAAIEPINGVTPTVRYNIHTGEERVA